MPRKLTVVFMDSQEGVLAKLTSAIADADINLVDIDAEENEDIGVIRVTVGDDDYARTNEILRETGHHVMTDDVLLVKIEDKPGALAKLAVKLAEMKVNVRSMKIVKRQETYCLSAIVAQPVDLARAALGDKVVA